MMLTNINTTTSFINHKVLYKSNPVRMYSKKTMLKLAVQCLREYGFDFNRADIASIAGVSERTAYNYKTDIEKWWTEDIYITYDTRAFIESSIIAVGPKTYSGSDKFFEGILSAILGIRLKAEGFLADCTSIKSLLTAGWHLAAVYGRVVTKDGKGVFLNASNTSAKAVLRLGELEVSQLFERSKDYRAGQRSRRWKPTERMNGFVEDAVDVFLSWLADKGVFLSKYPPTSYAAAIAGNSTYIYNTINKYIEVDIGTLKTFSYKSIFILLSNGIDFINNKIIIPIRHVAHTNEDWGRTYNVFCQIRAVERRKLGYIGYDMSAGLQAICLRLIHANEDDFPLLFKYAFDTDFKHSFRENLAKELGKSIIDVKQKLTAFANGLVNNNYKNENIRQFQYESDLLRKETLNYAAKNDPDVLEIAISQSRRILPEDIDWFDILSTETIRQIRDKSSVFFFLWTWYERLIRKAMLSVLPDGIEVHDAVYSKLDMEPKIVEDAIFRETGFMVLIGKEL